MITDGEVEAITSALDGPVSKAHLARWASDGSLARPRHLCSEFTPWLV